MAGAVREPCLAQGPGTQTPSSPEWPFGSGYPTRSTELRQIQSTCFASELHSQSGSVEELDPGGLEGGDLSQGLRPRLGGAALKIGDCLLGDFGMPDEVLLRPVEKGAGGTALRRREAH